MAKRKRLTDAADKAPATFPIVIKPHAYNESGLKTCLHCGLGSQHRLHIRPHRFEVNLDSKLKRCMCGYNEFHSLHKREVSA